MPEKYNLQQMLEEIEEDNNVHNKLIVKKKLSQDEIQKLISKRKKKRVKSESL